MGSMTFRALVFALLVPLLLATGGRGLASSDSPVTESHLATINDLLKQNDVPKGYAALDRFGRVQLKGEYNDEAEVDRAFSLAQTVVGIRWVSPVTPENIKVKEWEKRASK